MTDHFTKHPTKTETWLDADGYEVNAAGMRTTSKENMLKALQASGASHAHAIVDSLYDGEAPYLEDRVRLAIDSPPSGWVSVSERMPEPGVQVLLRFPSGARLGFLHHHGVWCSSDSGLMTRTPLYWLAIPPLPPPPTEPKQ